MKRFIENYDLEDFYLIEKFPEDKIPTRKCRAIIIGIDIDEREEAMGNIDIDYLILDPLANDVYFYTRHLVDWPIDSDVAMAYEVLEGKFECDDYTKLFGAVFDVEISYKVHDGKVYSDLYIEDVVALPMLKA